MAQATWDLEAVTVEVHEGDLTRLPFRAGALVSSDDNHMSRGGGVSAALFQAASDPRIESEFRALLESAPEPLRCGQVVHTSAGRLQADHLLHAVTIDLDRGIAADPETVEQMGVALVREARRLGINHVATPLLATGHVGLAPVESALALLRGIDRVAGDGPALKVTLVTRGEAGVTNAVASFVEERRRRAALAEPALEESAQRLPEPLAQAARALRAASSPAVTNDASERAVRFVGCFDAFEILVGVLFNLLQAEAERQGIDAVNGSQRLLRRASLGRIVEHCERTARQLDRSRMALPDLVSLWERPGAFPDAVYALLSQRNRWAHVGPASVEPSWRNLVSLVGSLLDHLRFLDDMRVVPDGTRVPRACDLRPAGDVGGLAPIRSGPEAAPDADDLTLGRVADPPAAHLVSANGSRRLDLDPWFLVASPSDGASICYLCRADGDRYLYYDQHGRKWTARWQGVEPASDPPVQDASEARAAAVAVAESPAESLGRGATPLHKLALLVDRYLSDDDREHLQRRFEALGFRGSRESLLIEYCLERDLAEVLTEMFSEARLHRIHRAMVPQAPLDPLTPAGAVARRILRALKVPVPAVPRGLESVRKAVERAAVRLETARDRSHLRGLVNEASAVLERVLGDLVRFYGFVLLGPTYEVSFHERAWMDKRSTVARAALGTLFGLLQRLADACEAGGTPEAARFAEMFPGRTRLLGPAGPDEQALITRVRNRFSHASVELEAMTDDQLRSLAREMFEALAPFLDHLARSRVYPRVVAVRETVRDAFGRQFVRAQDEAGHEEKIFTDEPLDPGAAYFMHPLTNPVRIYPILVRVQSEA